MADFSAVRMRVLRATRDNSVVSLATLWESMRWSPIKTLGVSEAAEQGLQGGRSVARGLGVDQL